jgi:ATP-dependent RNA helicase DDX27
MEEDKEVGDEKVLNAAIRSAKKSARPSKIGVPEKRPSKGSKSKGKPRRVTSRVGGAFERDVNQKASHREGVRAKKGDAIGRIGKKDGSSRKGK